ncbi:MAG: ABC transporter permease [Actinomycetota bacterium]|nr:ABC transporter permease [Actinomycetota bacterium]
MARFLVSRAAGAVAVLVVLVTIVFLLQSVVPGDPVRARVGANASPAVVALERHALGLDRPLTDQYFTYLKGALGGNLGQSIRTSQPVMTDIGQYLPATIELAIVTMFLAVLGGGLLGIAAATTARGAGLLRTLFVSGASAPTFLLGFGLIYIFYLKLGWLPASGQTGALNAPSGPTGFLLIDGLLAGTPGVSIGSLQYLVLPATSLALLPAVAIGRVLRSSLLEVYDADYIRTARAKGLAPAVVLRRHALRNAMSAPLTMTGLQFGLLLGGVVVVETIFAWPGIGLYLDQSIGAGDLPAITGVTLVLGATYVIVNILVDIGQAVVDPRVTL